MTFENVTTASAACDVCVQCWQQEEERDEEEDDEETGEFVGFDTLCRHARLDSSRDDVDDVYSDSRGE